MSTEYKIAYLAVKKALRSFVDLSPKQQEMVLLLAKADLENGVIDQKTYESYTTSEVL